MAANNIRMKPKSNCTCSIVVCLMCSHSPIANSKQYLFNKIIYRYSSLWLRLWLKHVFLHFPLWCKTHDCITQNQNANVCFWFDLQYDISSLELQCICTFRWKVKSNPKEVQDKYCVTNVLVYRCVAICHLIVSTITSTANSWCHLFYCTRTFNTKIKLFGSLSFNCKSKHA